ncbi:DNA repair protein [Lactarius akahatsu]|uniref:DNA repair protein n=1 Tax=Lactarius akahatsu TaxID=416441 RepID=A0AAD4LKS2_9AGAM|nr:DNA repair protein [Lactarius akahatsu]
MHARTSVKEREARILELESEIAELQKELGPGEDAQQIVSRHIKLLHRYNEAKDAAQIIIGKLAAHKQTTIRQIHEDYGLTGDD